MMEQKQLSYDELQLAHHLINELFRILGTVSPWPYPVQGTMPISLGAPMEPWQSSYGLYGQAQGILSGRAVPQHVLPFGHGFIPIY